MKSLSRIGYLKDIRIFFYCFFLFEFLQRICTFYFQDRIQINKFFLIFFLGYVLIDFLKKHIFIEETLILFLISLGLLGISIFNTSSNLYNWNEFKVGTLTYPFFFLIKDYVLKKKDYVKKRDLINISFFISTLILLGFFFEIFFLRTYIYGKRFGYSGPIRSSAISYIAITIYILLSTRSFQKYFFLLAGTKALYLGTLLFEFFNFIKNKKRSLLSVIMIASIIIILTVLKKLGYSSFKRIVIEYDWLTAFTSYRNILVSKKLLPHISENWNWNNYLFGEVMIYNEIKTEMAFFDIIINFGILGGGIFIGLVIWSLRKLVDLQYGIIILMALLTGNFFTSALVIFITSFLLKEPE